MKCDSSWGNPRVPGVLLGFLYCVVAALADPVGAQTPFPPRQGRLADCVPLASDSWVNEKGLNTWHYGYVVMDLYGTVLQSVDPRSIALPARTDLPWAGAPLAFSPDGTSLAVDVDVLTSPQSGLYLIRIGDESERVRVTDQRNVTAFFSPQGSLAVIISMKDEKEVSVFEGDSLRALYSHASESAHSDLAEWNGDGTAIVAAPVASYRALDLVWVPVARGDPRTIYSGTEPIQALEWDPTYETLAFNTGSTLRFFEADEIRRGPTIGHGIRAIHWSPDGSRLALCGKKGEVTIVTRKIGAPAWHVTQDIGNRAYVPEFVWIDDVEFAFALAARAPDSVQLYRGSLDQESLEILDSDVALAELNSLDGGVLYFKILDRGPWYEWEEDGWDVSYREVALGLAFRPSGGPTRASWIGATTTTIQEGRSAGVEYSPVLWLKRN